MALIWGSVLGFAIWDEIPTGPMIAGAAIVTLTGLYLLRHEAFRRPARTSVQCLAGGRKRDR
jgi:drug/metabolite transporter (DMT)-like permease